ncbi:MAG: hypothetical protein JF612_13500, partial [Planctomycetia bacterium]|nr:hypothetical protein [Planctomycetia bacterium]
GSFNGLPEGQVFSVSTGSLTGTFQITYHGGDGNDAVLAAVSPNLTLQGTPGDDSLQIVRNGANIDVKLNGTTISSLPLASSAGLIINGLDGNDTLALDLSSGNVIPAGGMSFNGGDPTTAPGDKLVIIGGNQGTVTYTFTNGHDGRIVMSNFGSVNYTGLEPVTNNGTATDIIFTLPASASTAILEDDGTIGNGLSQLRSGNGTFETTTFVNPTGSLTINRGNAADTMLVTAAPDLTSSLTLGSWISPLNSVSYSGSLTLATAKNLTSYAATQSVAATIALTVSGGGAIGITADNFALNNTATLSAAAGVVTIAPLTTGRPVSLGSEVPTQLSLTDFELDRIVAGTLRLGDSTFGGPIAINAPINVAN